MLLLKTSTLLYRRIFPLRPFRIAVIVMETLLVSFTIGAFFSTLLQCVPIEAAWDLCAVFFIGGMYGPLSPTRTLDCARRMD